MAWADGEVKWMYHVHFQEEARNLIDEFFFVNSHLDFYSVLEVPWEHRCVQCNEFLRNDDVLKAHVLAEHTYPVKKGTLSYKKTYVSV